MSAKYRFLHVLITLGAVPGLLRMSALRSCREYSRRTTAAPGYWFRRRGLVWRLAGRHIRATLTGCDPQSRPAADSVS
jgi:hypothetical protein